MQIPKETGILKMKNTKKQRAIKEQLIQFSFCDEGKRMVRRLKLQSWQIFFISPDDVQGFCGTRWNECPEFDYEQVDQLFPICTSFNDQMNERVKMQLLGLEAIGRLISTREIYQPRP
jgi:hypothetical protein